MGFLNRFFGKKQKVDQKQNTDELHGMFFPFIIYDEGEQIEPNNGIKNHHGKIKILFATMAAGVLTGNMPTSFLVQAMLRL